MQESKSCALPLGYTPIWILRVVGEDRFELPNPKELIYSQPRLATSLLTHSQILNHVSMVDVKRLELLTPAV